MAEYIERETLMKFPIRRDHCDKEHANEHFINGIETVMEYAENLPAADVEPVRHGRWEGYTHSRYCGMDEYGDPVYRDGVVFYCSNPKCMRKTVVKENYCPNCGAKMDGGKNHDD